MKTIIISEAGNLDSAVFNPISSAGNTKAKAHQLESVSIKPLDNDERKLLEKHQVTIKTGLDTFLEVGMAFQEIRDQGLYREYGTFEEYCQKVWNISRAKAYRFMAASNCVDQLKRRQLATSEPLAIPQSEAQARSIAKLPAEKQVIVSRKVAKKTDQPTTKDFEEAAAEVEDEKPHIRTYDIEAKVQVVDEDSDLHEADYLMSWADLLKLATQIYDDYNRGNDQKVRSGLRALEAELKTWADWQPNMGKEVA